MMLDVDDKKGLEARRQERLALSQLRLAQHGNAYNIFILVLTIFSLFLILLQLLPIDDDTRYLVAVYDNVVCVIFLIDFTYNMILTKPSREYFLRGGGWLDLIGSIPTVPWLPYTGLLRFARVARLIRILRSMRGQAGRDLIHDVYVNRGQYAVFITILSAIMVLALSSISVLQFESRSPDANIKTGGDALWWAVVTITTVGYGDFYPVTTMGRLTALFVMLAGVGIIGALASILASFLVSSPEENQAAAPVAAAGAQVAGAASVVDSEVAKELAKLRGEIASLRERLEKRES